MESWTGILEVDGYASSIHAHFQVMLCPTMGDCYTMSQQMDLLAYDLYYHTIQCLLIQERTECSEQWLDLVHFNTNICN